MPEPVIVHVISTTVLLSAALLVIASVALVQQINYVRTLNVMLSEAAESCAKQIVELVSVHTLGGEDHTYLKLTLPRSLGGQPYNLTLANVGENMIMVIAQLQLHRQVRIVVTPNFGQAPVYAVSEATRFGDLVLLPTILLPTPPEWETALVAVRREDAILVGFTHQPPVRAKRENPPRCEFLDWTRNIRALSGSRVLVNFTIYNPGDFPVYAEVELIDSSRRRLGREILLVRDGWVAYGSIPVQLVIQGGKYLWNLVCATGYVEPASVSVVLEVVAPKIEVVSVNNTIIGEPGSIKLLNITLKNTGPVAGTVSITLSSSLGEMVLADMVEIAPLESRFLQFQVPLPSTPGSLSATLKVLTIETGEVIPIPISLRAGVFDPYISWINGTIVGLPGWRPKLYVKITNPADTEVSVSIQVNGVKMKSDVVPARGTSTFVVQPSLPEQKGIYTWQVDLLKGEEKVSSTFVVVEVRDYKTKKQEVLYEHAGQIFVEDKNRNTGQKRVVTTRRLDAYLLEQMSLGVWIAVKVYLPSTSGINGGVAFESADKMYEVSAYNFKLRGRVNTQLYFRLYDHATNQWGSPTLSPPVPLPGEGYYPLHVFARCDGTTCTLKAYLYIAPTTELALEHGYKGSAPEFLSLLVDEYAGKFTEIVIRGDDTRYITIRGLPEGWIAEIWDGNQLIARSSDGNLLVPTQYVLNNAVLRLIDPYGEYSRSWELGRVLGGDLIELSSS